MQPRILIDYNWLPIKDGDPRAYEIMKRHYTFHDYADGRRHNPFYRARHLFCGPGEKMVLMTVDCDALFVWRKFIDASGQQGVNCAVFRNESNLLSSALILEAEQVAWQRWPGERLYTYVSPKVKSAIPGWCFIRARWKRLDYQTGSGLIILEKLPKKQMEAMQCETT